MMSLSPEERRAAMRGLRDRAPALAPFPLAVTVLFHAIWITVTSEVERRGGRWRYLPAGAGLLGLMRLQLEARDRYGRRRARAAGIELRRDAPVVPQSRTMLWVGLMIPITILRRVLGHAPRRQTVYEMGAATLARELVEWWAWRPYLSHSRRRAAPRA